jgi:hypothetical protein
MIKTYSIISKISHAHAKLYKMIKTTSMCLCIFYIKRLLSYCPFSLNIITKNMQDPCCHLMAETNSCFILIIMEAESVSNDVQNQHQYQNQKSYNKTSCLE